MSQEQPNKSDRRPPSFFESYQPFQQSEGEASKLSRKSGETPLVPIAMAAFVAILGIGAYKFKTRGSISTSMFLMQLRVASQGTVVGILTLGVAYSMLNDYVFKPNAAAITDSSTSTKNN